MVEVVECVCGCNPVEGFSEGVFEFGGGAEFTSSEFVLDLRVDLFDGIEVGAVRRQVEYAGIDVVDSFDGGLDLVGGEVVHNEDVAGTQLWSELLADIGSEEFAVESAVDDEWREKSAESEGGDEGGGFPVPERSMIVDALVGRPPSVESRHGGGAEGFVEENKSTRVDAGGEDIPDGAIGDDVGAVLLGGVERFFLRLILSCLRASQRLGMVVSKSRSRLRSSRVVPGLDATWARIRVPSRSASDVRLLARDLGSIEAPDLCKALMDRTQVALVPRTSAISEVVMPSLVSAMTRWRNSAGNVFIVGTPGDADDNNRSLKPAQE